LEAEGKVAAAMARESARMDNKLADIRRPYPFLSIERCAHLLEFEESVGKAIREQLTAQPSHRVNENYPNTPSSSAGGAPLYHWHSPK
jgi:hypothetical protein